MEATGADTTNFEARVHLAMGRPDAAADVVRALVIEGPDAGYRRRLRAEILVLAELWPEALDASRAFLAGQQERHGDESPYTAGGHVLVGRALLGLADVEGARASLEAARARMGPDHSERSRADELGVLLAEG